MASSIQRRRGTTSDHSTFTGAVGEITIDTTKDTVVVHDGAVVGGVPLLREDGSNSSLALGSQGVPSLKFSGDPNTGIYSPGADQLAVATNGTSRLSIDASGSISINATGPKNSDGYNTTHFKFLTLQATTGGTDRGAILELVGTGGGSPGYWLGRIGFFSTGNSYPHTSIFAATDSGGSNGAALIFNTTTTANVSSPIERGRFRSDGTFEIKGAGTAGTSPGFSVNPSTPANSFVIDSSGRLGIGTSNVNAGSKLHIARNNGGDSATVRLSGNDGAGDGGAAIVFADNETVKWTAFTRRFSSANKLYISTAEGDTTASKVTITEGGLVGIGTTSPNSVLQVNSGTNLGGILIGFSAGSSNFYDADLQVFRTGNGTERARIDSSGRLLVGTTSDANGGQVEAKTAIVVSGNPAYGKKAFIAQIPYATTNITSSLLAGFDGNIHGVDLGYRYNGTGYDLCFATNSTISGSPTERMRISSSGLVSITGELTSNGKIATSVPAAVTSFSAVCNAGDQTATSLLLTSSRTDVFYHIQAFNGVTTECFRVEANGNTKNTNNSYGALSDAKIKETIVDATPKLVDLMQVKVRNYNLIGETTKQIGVVAQELESVFPAMVDENADRDENGNLLTTTTKGVKYSVFVPILIKALQEAVVKIESLEARLTAAGL